jgi:hypothetical protein
MNFRPYWPLLIFDERPGVKRITNYSYLNKERFTIQGIIMESTNSQETGVIEILLRHLERGKGQLSKGDIKSGPLRLWSSGVKNQVQKIYGSNSKISQSLSPKLIPDGIDYAAEMDNRIKLVENYIDSLERIGSKLSNKSEGSRVFIGHGRSTIWRELKDFIHDRLKLQWDEFNREPVAGIPTFDRISAMLESASFAFLIMTAEDLHQDDTTHARQNVVHELGLFQGRLGPRKAIILLEDGCTEFSNITGLSQIRFPPGRISAVFEDIRGIVEREGLIRT